MPRTGRARILPIQFPFILFLVVGLYELVADHLVLFGGLDEGFGDLLDVLALEDVGVRVLGGVALRDPETFRWGFLQ
jgi:hypothetical protein